MSYNNWYFSDHLKPRSALKRVGISRANFLRGLGDLLCVSPIEPNTLGFMKNCFVGFGSLTQFTSLSFLALTQAYCYLEAIKGKVIEPTPTITLAFRDFQIKNVPKLTQKPSLFLLSLSVSLVLLPLGDAQGTSRGTARAHWQLYCLEWFVYLDNLFIVSPLVGDLCAKKP